MDSFTRISELRKSDLAEDRVIAIFMDLSIGGKAFKEHQARWRAKDVLNRFLQQRSVIKALENFAKSAKCEK